MISAQMIKAAVIAALVALVLGACMAGGWHMRGVKADRDMAQYKVDLQEDQRKAQEKVDLLRQADAKNTSDSTARLDTAEQTQQAEVQYVDREVIKYRDRPVAGKCTLPAEWVRLYNRAGAASNVSSTANP